MADLDKDIAAFKKMQAELEAHHKGKWVVFRAGELVGVYDSFDSAAVDAVARFGEGPFLIRQLGAGDFVMPASVMYRLVPQHA
jgi:hypothetical protein